MCTNTYILPTPRTLRNSKVSPRERAARQLDLLLSGASQQQVLADENLTRAGALLDATMKREMRGSR